MQQATAISFTMQNNSNFSKYCVSFFSSIGRFMAELWLFHVFEWVYSRSARLKVFSTGYCSFRAGTRVSLFWIWFRNGISISMFFLFQLRPIIIDRVMAIFVFHAPGNYYFMHQASAISCTMENKSKFFERLCFNFQFDRSNIGRVMAIYVFEWTYSRFGRLGWLL